MTEVATTPAIFIDHIAKVTEAISNKDFNQALELFLNEEFPASGAWFEETKKLVLKGCSEGWLCGKQSGGIKFCRAAKASDLTHGMSIDVVEMNDIVGPHHYHPNGEADLVIPVDGDPTFDGAPSGWKVYAPGTEHSPTVTGGKALILYLLPGGAIHFPL